MTPRSLAARVAALLRLPFASPWAAPFWLLLRIHLGTVWFQFGLSKLRGGWLATNPMEGVLRAIAEGNLPSAPGYARLAEWMLALGADRVLSVGIPLVEVAIAAALVVGVPLVPTALAAAALNANLILAGIASVEYDGRIILMQLLLVAAGRVAGLLGAGPVLRRLRRARAGDAWRGAGAATSAARCG